MCPMDTPSHIDYHPRLNEPNMPHNHSLLYILYTHSCMASIESGPQFHNCLPYKYIYSHYLPYCTHSSTMCSYLLIRNMMHSYPHMVGSIAYCPHLLSEFPLHMNMYHPYCYKIREHIECMR